MSRKGAAMRSKSLTVTILVFICLTGVIILQISKMLRLDRVYTALNQIDTTVKNPHVLNFENVEQAREEQTEVEADGDWLIWRLRSEPETLNPVTSKDLYAYWVCWRNIFEGLMEYDPDTLKLKPKLAESYSISEDGLEITFTLRSDIHFSEGAPITSDDVIFTYKTIRDPNVDAARWAQYYSDVESVQRIDERTVKFVMKKVYFKSLDYLSFVDLGILPKHIYQYANGMQFNQHRSEPVGSGPYVFEKWDVGRQILLSRNENYWGRKPHLKKIVFRIITNDLAAVQALRSGEVDFMRPEPDQYADLCADKEFTDEFRCLEVWDPRSGFGYMGWNEDTPFFKDRRVRLAMTSIIDRWSVCRDLLKGQAQVPAGPFYIYGPLYDPNIKPWPYDLDKAKQLLDQAGWKDTDGDGIRDKDGVAFRFKFMFVSGRGLHEQLAKHLKDQAAKVGIEVIADPYEWSVFLTRLIDRKFEAVTLAWFSDVTEDPYEMFHSSQIGNRGSNFVGFDNKEADKIMEQARSTLDESGRIKMYWRLDQIIHYEQPYTFLYTRPEQRFLQPRFKNVKLHKLGFDWLEWYVPVDQQKYK
jgi:peptide/nickel transport system substrate-binding protein